MRTKQLLWLRQTEPGANGRRGGGSGNHGPLDIGLEDGVKSSTSKCTQSYWRVFGRSGKI